MTGWLIRKDLPWLLPLFVASAVAVVATVTARDAYHTWVVFGSSGLADLQHALWIPAVLAGAVLALRDPLARTENLLAHRSVSPQRVYAARVVAGVAFVALLGATALVVDLLRLGLDGYYGTGVIAWPALSVVGALTLLATAAFAATFWALTLPASWFVRLAAFAALVAAIGLVHASLADGGRAALLAPIWPHALALAAITVSLLLAGRRLAAERADADHPASVRTVTVLAAVGGAATVLAAAFATSALQSHGMEWLARTRPVALVDTEGHAMLVRWRDRDAGTVAVLDGEQRVVAVQARDERMVREVHAHPVWSGLPDPFRLRFEVGQQAVQHLLREPDWVLWTVVLRPGAGVLRTVRQAFDRGGRRVDGSLAHSGGRRFSERAVLVEVARSDREAIFVADPGDGGIWRVELTAAGASLVPAPLPGDRVVDAPAAVHTAEGYEHGVAGREGRYWWDGSAWQLAPHAPATEPGDDEADALTPVLVVRDADGAEVMRHRVALSSFGDHFFATLAAVPAALRPLPSAVATVLAPNRTSRRPWYQDPVLADRAWLLILPLLGTVWCLLGARRRLRALGANAARSRAWLAAVAIGGPVMWVFLRGLETDRAYRRLGSGPATAPRIRAQNARTGAAAGLER